MVKNRFLLDGKQYDAQYRGLVEDISLFLALTKEYGGPVLELACGTGRISIPLALEGFQVTGLDTSETMLDEGEKKAQERGVEISYLLADCRNFSLQERFKTILFPFNSIALLHHYQDLEACLGCVREHLLTGGVFIISLFNPSLTILSRDPEVYYPHATYDDPLGGGEVVVRERTYYDRKRQILYTKLHYRLGQKEWEEDLSLRIYYPEELLALLHYNGFLLLKRYGDFHRSPFKSTSSQQILICTKE